MNRDSASANVVFEEFVCRSLMASLLDKTLLKEGTWRVTRGNMSVLDGFSRLVICLNIENKLFFESFSLYTVV